MDYAGLIGKHRINRPLGELERAQQLKQKQRLNVEPHYQLSVVKMNSTYLESVDKWFGSKGFITGVALIIAVIFVGGLGLISMQSLLQALGVMPASADLGSLLAFGIAMSILAAAMGCIAVWFLRIESFAYTHYPIRFNRKTGTVHVFRTDGTVMSVPWDKVFFTLVQVDQFHGFWNVMGHVLAEDLCTIEESFALSISETGTPDGILLMQSHWEFVRRYMEDGPETITGQVQFCLPISEQRESLTVGMHRLLANNSTSSPLLWPFLVASLIFNLLTVPFRFIAMHTSKIPQWPKDVESTCAIEPDDPYAIEGAPNGDRVAVFPEAVRTAGVGFTAPPGNPLATKKQTGTSPRAGHGIAKKTTANAQKKEKLK
jgi:hypothetical protein